MSLIGVDLNATRARAMQGTAAGPAPLALEPGQAELPMAVSLEERAPAVGRAGLSLARRLPHLGCFDFLPHIGTAKQWTAGRHRLDASGAMALVCQHLQPRFSKASGIVLTLPTYLGEGQTELVTQIAEKARWKVLGNVPSSVAAVLASREYLPWAGTAVVVDIDGYALTLSAVALGDDRARLVDVRCLPKLNLGPWLGCLIDGVARRCVRLSRRDPRASADTEQSLFEQLLAVLESEPRNGIVELNIHSGHWYQNLMIPVDELATMTAPLVEQVRDELSQFLDTIANLGPVGSLLLTSTAARLPGLSRGLEQRLPGAVAPHSLSGDSDFGEGLLDDKLAAAVHVVDVDGGARAAFELANRVHRGELTPGRFEDVAFPTEEITPVATGPARLSYRGQDHVLKGPCYALGREPTCDLVFDSAQHPSVSARHCEITRDKAGYCLRDRSRHGTFLNDHPITGQALLKPGDWIRLGPGGPLIRFLGQAGDPLQLVTFG